MRIAQAVRFAGLAVWLSASVAAAQEPPRDSYEPFEIPLDPIPGLGLAGQLIPGQQATCNPVYVGHKPGTFPGVYVDHQWDYDTQVPFPSDSTQGWTRWAVPYANGALRPAILRPEWAFDYGNSVNRGDGNLNRARDVVGRQYIRTGVAGVWHSDDMLNVRANMSNLGEPSSTPISGTRSAWCGLRAPGDQRVEDPLTDNYFNADLQLEYLAPLATGISEFPGYGNLWDQMLYKDFPSTSSGTVSARIRAFLSRKLDPIVNGSGWFNPDPTSLSNFVLNPADSLMFYAGSPREGAYDTDRRWFSEVLDMSKPIVEMFSCSGQQPVAGGTDTTLNLSYSGVQPVNGLVRIVIRVKTNRYESDETTTSAGGFNSKDGAALVDEVQVNGGFVYGFETTGSIIARSLIPDLSAVGGAWATTGRPPAASFHMENLSTLLFEDPNGPPGSPASQCNMSSNVLVAGNHDNAELIPIESYQAMESPTIDLAIRNTPGGTNAQGITDEMARRPVLMVRYDEYSGFMGLDQSVVWRIGLRYHGPSMISPVSGLREWSGIFLGPPELSPQPSCKTLLEDVSSIGVPIGKVDSLRVEILTQTVGYLWGGTDLGDTRGTYFDNVSAVFYDPTGAPVTTNCGPYSKFPHTDPGPNSGPPVGFTAWNKLQDTFPFNETVDPASTYFEGTTSAYFDSTTALMTSSLNIAQPSDPEAVVAGDTLVANATYGAGDGVTTGTRLDLVFRIDPGPANYSVPGDRTTPLIEKDPAHPFWAAYQANSGDFGTGGTGPASAGGNGGIPQGPIDVAHSAGTRWNKDWWNSCRMDSAEINVYPLLSRGIGLPVADRWMGAIHELDPKFPILGIDHNVCFLSDPNGFNDDTNIDCGTPNAFPPGTGFQPATVDNYSTSANGGPAPMVTKEGTKIIPDGYLSPGSHVEYFVRSSTIQDPMSYTLFFDTLEVYPHGVGQYEDRDGERFAHVDVLPDFWRAVTYGGEGLACMLLVDGSDRRGSGLTYRGTLDSLGYGKLNGAGQGWFRTDWNHDPAHANDASLFVAANLGQAGRFYDQFDIGGAEAVQAGRLGERYSSGVAGISPKIARQSPTPAMLQHFYHTVVFETGDLLVGTLHEGVSPHQGSDDVTMLTDFLHSGAPGANKMVWLSGDNVMESAVNAAGPLYNMLTSEFGADLTAPSYYTWDGSSAGSPVALIPTESYNSHGGRWYGIENFPSLSEDILVPGATTLGQEAGTYEQLGTAPWTASVFWPADASGRNYATILDGFDLVHVRGTAQNLSDRPGLSASDVGRIDWAMDNLATTHQGCSPGSVVGIDQPPTGGDGAASPAVLDALPNPAAAHAVQFRFRLDKARRTRISIYTVSGRRIATLERTGSAGLNLWTWDRRLDGGAKARSGVYFYTVEAEGVAMQGASRKLVLIGP